MPRIFYVNGAFVPEADAKISVLDRGFLFGDGVYEVTSVVDGRLVDNPAHLARLTRSRDALGMPAPASDDEIVAIQKELVARNDLTEGLVYLQVTRGAADRDFGYPENPEPSLVLFTQAKSLVDNPKAKTGIAVVSIPDIRWKRRDIKTVGLLGASMAKQAAIDAGVDDAWMIEDGHVTEGTANNSYIVTHEGTIVTRHLGNEILAGITRVAVLALAERDSHRIEERPFTIEEAQGSAEAFITGASTFVQPVVTIDGKAVGDGKPGPVTMALRQLYIEMARASDEATASAA